MSRDIQEQRLKDPALRDALLRPSVPVAWVAVSLGSVICGAIIAIDPLLGGHSLSFTVSRLAPVASIIVGVLMVVGAVGTLVSWRSGRLGSEMSAQIALGGAWLATAWTSWTATGWSEQATLHSVIATMIAAGAFYRAYSISHFLHRWRGGA